MFHRCHEEPPRRTAQWTEIGTKGLQRSEVSISSLLLLQRVVVCAPPLAGLYSGVCFDVTEAFTAAATRADEARRAPAGKYLHFTSCSTT